MRFTGPVRREVAKGGEFLISRARVLLGQVENRLANSSLQQLVSKTETGDGWYIIASNILGQRFIGIYKEPVDEIEGVCRVEYISGFLDWTNWGSFSENEYIDRISLFKEGVRSAWRTYPNPDDSEELEWYQAFQGGGTKFSCSPFFTAFRSSPAIQKSSCYSGEMCKVISLLQGYKTPIAFNYCWGETDGIWVASDGTRYVIRISILEGVTAWKLPVCEELTDERKSELGVDYPILPKPVTSVLPLAGRILLMTAQELAASGYSSAYPFSFEIGWSFSDDGHKAIQTTWTWPDEWKRAQLWEMAITSYTGQAPDVAMITKSEETYVWGDKWGNISFPQYLPQGGMALITFDPRADPVLSGAPPGSYARIPYYAFYPPGENATPVVIRTSDAQAPDDEDPLDREEVPGNYHWCAVDRATMKAPGVGNGVFGIGLVRNYSMKRFFEASGPLTLAVEPEESYVETGSMRVYSTFQDGGYYLTSASSNRAISQHWLSYTDYIPSGTHERKRYHTIIVPFFNRCGLMEFTKWREDAYAGAGTRFRDGAGFGMYGSWRTHSSWGELCTIGAIAYQAIPCDYPLPDLNYFTEFYFQGHGEWCSDPILAVLFTPGDSCYGTPEAHATRYYCRTGETPAPISSCPANGYALTDYYNEQDAGQELYAYNWSTGSMELVKEWEGPGSYDPFDAYMAVKDWDGGSVMVSHYEPFRLKGFQSKEMNGDQGDEYQFVGSPETKYPVLNDIGPGLDRTFFGVPFTSSE